MSRDRTSLSLEVDGMTSTLGYGKLCQPLKQHLPMLSSLPPLVLTLKLDQTTFDRFNELRQQHFPPARNFIPAHVSLFHALPGEQESDIRQALRSLCSQASTLPLGFPKPRFLGKGVAVEVQSAELMRLHQELATTWSDWLTAQDRQGYRSHITIQNKVTSDDAKQLYEQLTQTWKPFNGAGEGLLLWQYQGGPWELVEEFLFNGVSSSNALPVRPHSAKS